MKQFKIKGVGTVGEKNALLLSLTELDKLDKLKVGDSGHFYDKSGALVEITREADLCRKCNAPLRGERCTDETCPFESHPQSADLENLYEPKG